MTAFAAAAAVICDLGTLRAELNIIAFEAARISAPVPENRDGFGTAVTANATHIAVGAPGYLDFPQSEIFGSVYVYARSEHAVPALVRTIPGPQDSTDRRFGVSLAMGEDFLAIGSSNHFHKPDNPRAVVDIHVMNHPSPGAWGRAARIEVGSDAMTISDEIVSVATDAGTIFAGFHGLQKVAVIERVDGGAWETVQMIEAADRTLFDSFGEAVAVNGDWLAISAPSADDAGTYKGSVYLLHKEESGQWRFTQKLIPPAGTSAYHLGQRLSLSGEWLGAGDSKGDISIYRRNGANDWQFFQKLSNFAADYVSIHLRGDELLCGTDASAGATASGRGELFRFNAGASLWQRQAWFQSSRPATYGLMGEGALIDGTNYILGSGLRATGLSAAPAGTCHFFAKPAFDRYADWMQRSFSPEEIGNGNGAPEATNNPTEITNWLCYAMGMDPHSPDPAALPHMELDPADQRREFHFQIRPNAADFSWRAVSSTDLASWKNFKGSLNAVSYGSEVQMHFRKPPVSASAPQFFRLEVTPQNP